MADVNEDESPVVQDCIDIVAKQIAWKLFDPERALWEDYPEIGEFDWYRIVSAVEKLSPIPPDLTEYLDAHNFLAWRAER